MLRKLFRKNILVCIGLFAYQSCIDLKRKFLIDTYTIFQREHLDILNFFTIANRPGTFIVLYIVHRAFVHALIVRYFTGKRSMLKNYMMLDLVIFFFSFLVVAGRRIFNPYLDFTEPLALFLLKLLDTPLLLMFFLPSYYIFLMLGNDPKKERA